MKDRMKGYKFFRGLLGPIYRFWFKPKVIGKENIPNEGSIILAGNHIHIMDQCNIIISTKRLLHYMAKKEYFDDKKVAWFFRIVGCIPVDRSKKDNEAKLKAIEVLKNNHALGIFPEGTRNSLKKEELKKIYNKYFIKDLSYRKFKKKIKKEKKSFVNYLEELLNENRININDFKNNIFNSNNYLKELIKKKIITEDDYYENSLLPLKYGAVSMAYKTNSLIIPYTIVGEYKFRGNNLTIRIGKSFKADSDLEKSNLKLRNEIIKLMKNSD